MIDSTNLLWEITKYPNTTMLPKYQSDVTAWHGHIPFAFWLTQVMSPNRFVELGVHAGDSYMAFCQGIAASAVPGRAFGVDTFEGDEHSGGYSANMYEMVSEIHNPLYGKFSKLVKDRFETYAETYAEGPINLLHIDGLHTYEAVKRDFEMWLPKMADNGVIVMHDTAVIHQEGFGVWKFWGEIRREYPCFEFFHSNGLGVALVGPEPIEILYAMSTQDKTWQGEWIRQYFEMFSQRIYAQRKDNAE